MMVAAHYPFVGIFRARNFDHNIVESLDIPVRLYFQMDFRRARSCVIREGQGTAPTLRSYRSLQSFEQILCVSIGNRKNRNASEGLRVLQSQALRVFGSSYLRSQWVAGMDRYIHDAAALHPIWWTPRSLRICITFKIAVVPGIRIDQASHCAVLGGNFRLNAAPGIPVPC